MGVAKNHILNFKKERIHIFNGINKKYPNLKKILESMLLEDPGQRPTAENLLEEISLLEEEEPTDK